ncbi:hypothetical protein [Methylobacterium brachiatum]|uniref:hypothetical protein n=1 Tax=Methylobacterium brachiatum TaxID=269660 RepID=UPI000EFC359B|nr:hypothetical protein [Methylobacterium brachiatum]AYO85361.1 hypothetical protein EBB05_26150 [Methylobacterium brachiatum]
MQSPGERIGWLEADLRTLTARVEANEGRADSERWLEKGERDAFKRDAERERDNFRSEFVHLENRLAEYSAANDRDKYEGAKILAERIAWLSSALAVLTLVSLVEAVAIIALWWSR